ncbi:MAG: hypothetical protein ACRCUG_05965 [Yersinia sp. (in: enterobacteria)]
MGISEEESIRRLADEKSSIGHSAKWVAIISAIYFFIMLFYQRQFAVLTDAPRDKCAHFREINGIAAAFQYLQKNYNPTAFSFL